MKGTLIYYEAEFHKAYDPTRIEGAVVGADVGDGDGDEVAVGIFDFKLVGAVEAVSYTHLDVYKRQEYARTKGIPFLGICLGMQVAVIEYARHILSLIHISGKMNLPPCGRLPPDRKRRHAEKEHEIFHLICVA